MAGILLESPAEVQSDEGRAILNRLLAQENPPPETLSLAVRDAIRREAWREAERFLERLIAVRRNSADLFDGYRVERGLGNNSAALAYARELYNRQGNSDEAAAAYLNALIDTGRRAEAERIIGQKLTSAASGAAKSRYYYLRSRLETSDDMTMNDLRSSLFEDPRNLDALISLFTIYHRRGDIRRAAYYLKQAIAVSPTHPALRRYDAEYRARLGSGY
jgi:Tfp pilus assembly protein PilF